MCRKGLTRRTRAAQPWIFPRKTHLRTHPGLVFRDNLLNPWNIRPDKSCSPQRPWTPSSSLIRVCANRAISGECLVLLWGLEVAELRLAMWVPHRWVVMEARRAWVTAVHTGCRPSVLGGTGIRVGPHWGTAAESLHQLPPGLGPCSFSLLIFKIQCIGVTSVNNII